MKNINLAKEKIKILRVSIYCNKKIQDDLNFSKTIKNLCNVINLWHMLYKAIFARQNSDF